MSKKRLLRLALFIFSGSGLVIIYLLQHFDYSFYILPVFGGNPIEASQATTYSINKSVRFILNDIMALVMIYSIFVKKKFVIIGFLVQLFGLLFLLPAYLILHNYFYSETKVWLSFLHRLTLNPILLMLLIPAFYYHQKIHGKEA